GGRELPFPLLNRLLLLGGRIAEFTPDLAHLVGQVVSAKTADLPGMEGRKILPRDRPALDSREQRPRELRPGDQNADDLAAMEIAEAVVAIDQSLADLLVAKQGQAAGRDDVQIAL